MTNFYENDDMKWWQIFTETENHEFYKSTICLESTVNFITIRVPLQVSQKWGNAVPLEKWGNVPSRSPQFKHWLSGRIRHICVGFESGRLISHHYMLWNVVYRDSYNRRERCVKLADSVRVMVELNHLIAIALFLRATAYMLCAHRLSQFRPSVRPSVCMSHGWFMQKRL